jgi:anti-anti-sigma regulatory factor
MLKISTDELLGEVLLVLEGSLSGPWVPEVERAWQRVSIEPPLQKLRVDLSGVTFVSEQGRSLLERMCASGVELSSSDLQTRALCEELLQKHREIGNP